MLGEMRTLAEYVDTLEIKHQNQPDLMESEFDDDRIQNVHELINRSL